MNGTILPADPHAVYERCRSRLDAAMARVMGSGRYVLGPEVRAFEEEFAAYLGSGHAVGVASGTDALQLCLRAAGITGGDPVLTVSLTAVPTVAAIEMAGAEPVLVDIDPRTCQMSVESLRACAGQLAASGRKAAAVVPVHLYGRPVDMASLTDVTREYDLTVIEDCAQAHGATFQGRRVGTFGAAGGFSFYPTKNLGAFGDGGMVVTDDAALAERVRTLRQYGWDGKRMSLVPGINSRLDELHAAMLRALLPELDTLNAVRADIAEAYRSGLADVPVQLPPPDEQCSQVYHQFVIQCEQRDQLCEHLRSRGIFASIHYPVAVHMHPAYSGRVRCPGGLGATEKVVARILSLPMHPGVTKQDAERVVASVRMFYGAGA